MAATTAPAGSQDLSSILETITSCLSGTGSSLPKATKDTLRDSSIEPPQDGISLLDTKSELLLSYLHNLVFLAIFQLRNLSGSADEDADEDADENESLREDIVKKLGELRVYMERGVRPLEGRLKYQVDKVIKAADDAERDERAAPATRKTKKTRKTANEDESGSEEEEDEDSEEEDDEENEENINDMAYRPNVSAFSKGGEAKAKPDKSARATPSDGIYRPPRIMPTSLPTTERREREDNRPRRSNVIDEFVNAEMSSTPTMEASIGSTIREGGRHTRSQKEKKIDDERSAYEETNFVRLPKISKKDQAKQRGRGGKDSTFGGEDWKSLTDGADRISRLTQKSKGSGGALDKSRKRKPDETPRSDGPGVGQTFEKRRKKVDSWKR